MAAKQSAVRHLTHGAGSQLERGDMSQKTMEIFWGKITPILKGSYWRGQVESGIRRMSLCACNNREADGSDPEQLEQCCPFAYPKFIALPSGFTPLLLCFSPWIWYMSWHGKVCVLSWHLILEKPSQTSTNSCKSSGTLLYISWETCMDCTSKIPLLHALPVGSTPRMSVWGNTTTACLRA